ncbi:MAG: YMGG-like glycine zipper-containing protein [Pseudomonadota bacterium]
MRRFFLTTAAIAGLTIVAACGNTPGERALTGGAIGAGAGAVGGALFGRPGAGAAVGGAVGAATGALTNRRHVDLGESPF